MIPSMTAVRTRRWEKKGKEKKTHPITLKTRLKEAREHGSEPGCSSAPFTAAASSGAYHSAQFRELPGDCSKNTLSAMVKNNFLLSTY